MPTRPLDELDLSYTDEELRLLENWLVEHQGEWILDFGRKNWCFRGGGALPALAGPPGEAGVLNLHQRLAA